MAEPRPFGLEATAEDAGGRIVMAEAQPLQRQCENGSGRSKASKDDQDAEPEPRSVDQGRDHSAPPRVRSPVRNRSGDVISLMRVNHQKARAKTPPTTMR